MATKLNKRVKVEASQGFIKALAKVSPHLETGEVLAMANKITYMHHHAAKKHDGSIEDCSTCEANIDYLMKLTPKQTAVVLENAQARGFTNSLGTIIHFNGMKRFSDETRAGDRDYIHTAALFALHKKHFPEQYKSKN